VVGGGGKEGGLYNDMSRRVWKGDSVGAGVCVLMTHRGAAHWLIKRSGLHTDVCARVSVSV